MEARSLEIPFAGSSDDPVGDHAGGPASISGVEQEYAVWRDGGPVPFALLLGRVLSRSSARGFGEDPLARVRSGGAVWTADGPHAEIATPPRRLTVGIAGRLADDALHEREMLLRRLRLVGAADGSRLELRGYSTHINAFCRAVDPWAVVRRFAVLHAPAVMLLADRRDSPGLLVRPRPDRLEVGTEYLESRDDLAAVALVVLAATIECWEALAGRRAPDGDRGAGSLRALDSRAFQSTWQRPGTFIDRAAFGDDLYRAGRDARLRRADGGMERAGSRLDATWARLRPIASAFATEAELASVDVRVDGTVPLLIERSAPLEPLVRRGHRVPGASPGPNVELLRPMRHGALRVQPEALDWDVSLLRISHPAGVTYARVPRDDSARFAALVRTGALAPALAARAALGRPPRVTSPEERTPGLFDLVAQTAGDVPPPGASVAGSPAASAENPATRPARKATVPPPVPTSKSMKRRGAPLGAIVAIGVALLVVFGLVLAGGRLTSQRAPDGLGSPTAATSPDPSASQSPAATPCGAPAAGGQSCPAGSAASSASACPAGVACAPGSPLHTQTTCPAGVACSPGASPSLSPSARPTPRPTPSVTPSPTPGPTAAPPSQSPPAPSCVPATGQCGPSPSPAPSPSPSPSPSPCGLGLPCP
ncbi:MAG: hypothetical protein IVW53_13365 [Chloroflexi bacterium]|nr:hypothetical protein [Chloroflexota bacterium]